MGSSFGMTSTASSSGGILPTLSSSGITDSESTVSSASAMSGQTPGSSGTGIDDENYSIKSYEGLALSLSSFLLASLCTLGNLYWSLHLKSMKLLFRYSAMCVCSLEIVWVVWLHSCPAGKSRKKELPPLAFFPPPLTLWQSGHDETSLPSPTCSFQCSCGGRFCDFATVWNASLKFHLRNIFLSWFFSSTHNYHELLNFSQHDRHGFKHYLIVL